MMKYALCLEFFWKELPLAERIPRARAAGFDTGEIWGWRDRDLRTLADVSRDHGFRIVSISGMEPVPGFNDRAHHKETSDTIRAALDAAESLGCKQVIVLGGTLRKRTSRGDQRSAVIDALLPLAVEAHARGMWLALEILNSRHSFPGYFLDNTADQFAIVHTVGHPGLRVVYDLFHAGVMEGDHTTKLLDHFDSIASLQLAAVPTRNEPFLGELHHPAIVDALDARGFDGWTTLEYIPTLDSDESLARTLAWLRRTS